MDSSQLLGWVARLGQEFVRRGMEGHAQKLRLYFLAVEKGLVGRNHELEVKWSAQLVTDWMKALRLPPFSEALPVRGAGSGCAHCPKQSHAHPSVRTELVFPGGSRMRCELCGALWLELERFAPGPAQSRKKSGNSSAPGVTE